jgi:hypothetical protein
MPDSHGNVSIQARLVDMDPEYEKDLAWLPTLSMQCWQYNEKFENLKSVKQAKDLTDRSTCILC